MNETIKWNIIEKLIQSDANFFTQHHIHSYNDCVENGFKKIMMDNNPIVMQFNEVDEVHRLRIELYLGGVNANKVYFGKPVIYEDTGRSHLMYPNEARLRNMTYAMTVHYDVDCKFITYDDNLEKSEETHRIEKVYLGSVPIMTQSKYCLLDKLHKEVKYNMGECKNDYGGYFIIQ